MINYKLSKELKDAGFLQRFINGKFYAENDAEFKDIAQFQKELKFSNNSDRFISIPTLEELIDACEKSPETYCFVALKNYEDKWIARADVKHLNITDWAEGSTPNEAVAKLWLKLNE